MFLDDEIVLKEVRPPVEIVASMKKQRDEFCKPPSPEEHRSSISNDVRTQSIVDEKDSIVFSPNMKSFMVMGTGGVVQLVRFMPKPTCSCRPTQTCYHIAAVQQNIGVWQAPQRKTINLTQL